MDNQLETLKDDIAEKVFGMTRDDAWRSGICIQCKELARPKCYSDGGLREYEISAMCEECFDKLFA